MKISKVLLITSALLIAGCASNQRQAQHSGTIYNAGVATGSNEGDSLSGGFQTSGSSSGNYSTSPAAAPTPVLATPPQSFGLLLQVRQSLVNDPSLTPVMPDLVISENAGAITLSGKVSNEEQKNSIEARVRQTPGVVAVNNNIQVSNSMAAGSGSGRLSATSREQSGASTNQAIESNVGSSVLPGASSGMNEAFSPTSEANSGLSATSRTNATNNVYSGTPPSSPPIPVDSTTEQLNQTSQAGSGSQIYAGSQSTSESGQNGAVNVKVQGSSQTDQTLAQQISQELRTDASLAAAISQVSISVNDGRVTLQGTVKNDVQKREIESAVQRATGVSSVDNQLRVSSNGSPGNP